jgi:para-aminobenzoate synthetase/4-amino-4-deoxychorismate lyase
MRHDPGEGVLHLDRHLARLRASAAYFGFELDEAAVVAAIEREAARFPARPVRIRLSTDRRGRIDSGALPLPDQGDALRLAIDTTEPVDPSDPLLFHKTTLRRRYEDARARHPDADDVILTNSHGEVTESTIANLAVRIDGRWWTPPLDAGLLPGIGREVGLDDGWLAERPIRIEELRTAEEVALLSDIRGLRTATRLTEPAQSPAEGNS